MRLWIVGTAAALTIIGISSPRVAGRSGHMLLIMIGLIVAVFCVQPVFAAIEQRRAEPFVPNPPRTHRATMPSQMAEIVEAFTKHAGGIDSGQYVPPQLLRRITTAAAGRIIDHHHLHLSDTDDHAAIQQLVSPMLWALLRPPDSATRTAASGPAVPFFHLDPLLDELERL
jgi:hypothetical protein